MKIPIHTLIKPIVPVACEAFEDYRLHAMTLSRLEINAIRTGELPKTENKRELEEWKAKKAVLGL